MTKIKVIAANNLIQTRKSNNLPQTTNQRAVKSAARFYLHHRPRRAVFCSTPTFNFALRTFCNSCEKLRLAFSAASNIKNLFSSLDNTTYILYFFNDEILHFISEYAVEVEPNIAFAIMLRKNRGNKTQIEVADKLNISYQQYQNLENPKKTNPTLKTIAKLQKIFNYKFINF